MRCWAVSLLLLCFTPVHSSKYGTSRRAEFEDNNILEEMEFTSSRRNDAWTELVEIAEELADIVDSAQGCKVELFTERYHYGNKIIYTKKVNKIKNGVYMESLKISPACCVEMSYSEDGKMKKETYCENANYFKGFSAMHIFKLKIQKACRVELWPKPYYRGKSSIYTQEVNDIKNNLTAGSLNINPGCCVEMFYNQDQITKKESHCKTTYNIEGYKKKPIFKFTIEEDTDECADPTLNECTFKDMCENTKGSYKCKCQYGYTLQNDERTCKDIDECASPTLNKCPIKDFCNNTEGSFDCWCKPGYRIQLSLDGMTCEKVPGLDLITPMGYQWSVEWDFKQIGGKQTETYEIKKLGDRVKVFSISCSWSSCKPKKNGGELYIPGGLSYVPPAETYGTGWIGYDLHKQGILWYMKKEEDKLKLLARPRNTKYPAFYGTGTLTATSSQLRLLDNPLDAFLKSLSIY